MPTPTHYTRALAAKLAAFPDARRRSRYAFPREDWLLGDDSGVDWGWEVPIGTPSSKVLNKVFTPRDERIVDRWMRKIPKRFDRFDADKLAACGLSVETCVRNGLRTNRGGKSGRVELKAIARTRPWWGSAGRRGVLVFPHLTPDGKWLPVTEYARIRPHEPGACTGRDGKKKPAKYLSPKGEPTRAYFPAETLYDLKTKPGCRVFITEGEFKALAMAQLGLTAISLPGVDNFRNPEKTGLKPDLAAVRWEGRTVYIVYDNDPKPISRSNVTRARSRLTDLLYGVGAKEVFHIDPPADGDGKGAIDDHLADLSRGRRKAAMRRLIRGATLAEAGNRAPERHAVTLTTRDGQSAQRWQPFPVETFPPVMERFVLELSRVTGFDESYTAVPLLVACAGATGNNVRLVLNSEWAAPPAIWGMVIGVTGEGKSPAFGKVKNMVQEIALEFRAEYDEVLKTFERKKGRKGRDEPQPRRILTDDMTIEAVTAILEHNPLGLVTMCDEAAAFFGSLGQYKAGGSADEAQYLSMYDGQALITDRKMEGTRGRHIPSALLSLCAGVQPAILQKIFHKERRQSGLVPRFLVAHPPSRAAKFVREAAPDEARGTMKETLRTLFRTDARRNLTLEPAAMERWAAWHDLQEELRLSVGEDEAAFVSKLKGYAPRFAAVFHCVRHPAGGNVVPVETIDDAIRLAEWFLREALRLLTWVDAADLESDRNLVIEKLRGKAEGLSASDMVRAVARLRTVADARRSLDPLVEEGTVERFVPPADGQGRKPGERYRLK